MPRPAQPRVLVSRWLDGWLVGWLAVLAWIVVFAVQQAGGTVGFGGLTAAVYWAGAIVTAAHFGLSYHLAYSGGTRSVRARPVALLYGPAGLATVLGALVLVSLAAGSGSVAHATSALITSVYLLTTWHYVKQVYGVARVGAAYAGVRLDRSDIDVLRFGLYPLWFVGAAQVLVTTHYNFGGFPVGFDLLPAGSLAVLRVVAMAAALPVAWVFVRISLRRSTLPPGILLAPYLAAFLWLGLPQQPVVTLLLLAPFHALQYLAIGHRAEVAVAEEASEQRGLLWWLNIFAGAACGGLLLSRWLPSLLDSHVRSDRLLFATAFFVFLNLHHYLIDATIWRSSGNLVRAMVRTPASPAPTRELVDS